MSKVIVLGGCGTVGATAVKTLANNQEFSEIVIGDINVERAREVAAKIASPKVSVLKVDVLDAESIKKAIADCDVVLNCTGPFFKFVKLILKTVIEAKKNYVDVCDDVDVTLDILDMDEDAKKAGISALIGMGSSPGTTNILAKFAAESLLDETDSIDFFHAHGGEPSEGEGVIGHRFHCMSIDIPMFLDGELKYVKYFEEDGIALREDVVFHKLGDKGITVYPYPHPEQVTIPKYIKTRRVTNKGTVIPDKYYDLTRDLCMWGLSSKELLNVRGQMVTPYDFAVAYILQQREVILKETNFGPQRGCVKVVVKGKKGGKNQAFIFSLASEDQALGEGTGIPAAMGAILMNQGKITTKGVFPPEGGVDPATFLSLVPKVMSLGKEGGKSFEGVIVEHVDEMGKITKIDTKAFLG